MRSYKTEAIVVKRNNFGESDRILTVFTKNQGLIKVKAKGVRKINSRRGPHVELLNLSVLSLYEGSKMAILTEVETINSFEDLKNDLGKIGMAYHICELINGLCAPYQENRMVFSLILQTFQKLCNTTDSKKVITDFEIELLTILGFWKKDLASDNIHFVIEGILERKLKTARMMSLY